MEQIKEQTKEQTMEQIIEQTMEQTKEHQKERRKLLVKYVLPSTLSMISVFLFTVVDGIFVGQGVGQDALGAVNIAFPYIMIFSAAAMLTTVGGLTITAIRRGRKDEKGMNEAFMHSLTATLAVSTVFALLGTVFADQMAKLMGANETFHRMVRDYIFWYAVFMIPCGLNLLLCGFIRNDGNPVLVSFSTVFCTGLNIFGDWLLIFPLGMGLAGAAIATGVSQTVGLLILLFHFILRKGRLRFSRFKPNRELVRLILVRGLPECISQFNPPIVTILYNYVLIARLGDMAVNAYSVIGYVASFAVAAFVGVAEGLQPLFGNCYGAGREADLLWYRRRGIMIGLSGAVLIYVLLLFLGGSVCSLYALDEATMECTLSAMPKYALGFIIQSVTVVISSYLYSTTRTREALKINLLRSFLVNTAVILLIPAVFGSAAVWYSFAVYELIVLLVAVFVMRHTDSRGILGSAAE